MDQGVIPKESNPLAFPFLSMAVTQLVEELPEACNLNSATFAHMNVLSQSPELSKYRVINHPGAAGK